MRVTFVSPVGFLGGGERSLLDLIAALKSTGPGAELTLLTLASGELVERAKALGLPVVIVPLPGVLARLGDSGLKGRGAAVRLAFLLKALAGVPALLAFVWRFRRALAGLTPDLVHSNGIKTHILTGLARPRGARLIWHVRDFLGLRSVTPRLLRPLSRQVDCIVSISGAVQADARRALPGPRHELVYNAIDVEAFADRGSGGEGAWLDGLAGLTGVKAVPVPLRIGLVATYARWKGHGVYIDAAARALAALPAGTARFYIVGGPVYGTTGGQFSETELRQLAAARRVDGALPVHFVPFQTDPAPVLRALDIVVHASSQPEPFGRTVVEAMAAGKALVATAAGGVPELAHDGADALLVPPGDPETMATALIRLCQDASLRRDLGEAGRINATARFGRARLGVEMGALYQSLMPRLPS